MFDNILHEIPHVEKLYTEQLRFINTYHNFNRQSIFCRYYNINIAASTYNPSTQATFDRYNSGLVYDVYDLTPIYNMTSLINESENDESAFGQKFTTTSTLSLYSVETPRIEDLVVFNQKPLDGKEIFRVSNIRASINSMTSSPKLSWFDASIEYAPIIDISKLNILNYYVYSLPMQRYLFQDDFKRYVSNIETFNKILKNFENNFFDSYQELYFVNVNGVQIFPKYENYMLNTFLSTKSKLSDLFMNIKRPFTAKLYSRDDLRNDLLDQTVVDFCKAKPNNIDFNTLNPDGFYDIFDICGLIRSWIWYLNYEKYPEHIYDYEMPNVESNIPMFTDNGLLYKSGPKMNLIVDVRTLPRNVIEEKYGL